MKLVNFLAAAILFLTTACTISLLPGPDAAIYEGLNTGNQSAQTLFSALSGGSPKSEFSRHAAAYDKVIGTFSAIRNRADTRPEPALGGLVADRLKKIPRLTDACNELSAEVEESGKDCLNLVTPHALDEIVETLSRLRDVHRASGLGPVTLESFVGDYEISIEQALTVEGALQ